MCPAFADFLVESRFASDRAGVTAQKKSLLADVNAAMASAPDEVEVFDIGSELLAEIATLEKNLPARADAKLNTPDRGRMEPCVRFGADRFGVTERDLLFLCPGRYTAGSHYSDADERNLIEALRRVTMSRHSRHVTFEVAGGGTYRIPNCKRNLENFSKSVAKAFPTWLSSSADLKASGKKEVVAAGATAPKPTAIPKLAKKVGPDDIEQAAGLIVNPEHSKPQLREVMHDGSVTVATDGRAISIFCGGQGMSPDAISKKHGASYPNWTQVIPSTVRIDGVTLKPSGHGICLEVDSEVLARVMIGLRGALHERRDGLGLHAVGAGLGISYDGNGDHYEEVFFRTEGVEADAQPLITLNHTYVSLIARQARQLGVRTIKILIKGEQDPATFFFEGRGITVCMPMRSR